jgi:hypothetical protein
VVGVDTDTLVDGAGGDPIFPAEGSDHRFAHQPSITTVIEFVDDCDMLAGDAQGGSGTIICGNLDTAGGDTFTCAGGRALGMEDGFSLAASGIYDDESNLFARGSGLAVHESGGDRSGYVIEVHESNDTVTRPHMSLDYLLLCHDPVTLGGPVMVKPLQVGRTTIDSSPHLNDRRKQMGEGGHPRQRQRHQTVRFLPRG